MLAAVPVFALVGYALGERWLPGMGTAGALFFAVIAFKGIAPALLPKSSTVAWLKGSVGEQEVARVLDGLPGWHSLHDRLMPGSRRANIDHLTVGPGGVFTVDAKRYQGRLTVARDGTVRIKGRDCTKLPEQARRQAAAVSGLAQGPVHVAPVLCFVGTELPRRHQEVQGVHLVTLRGLGRFLRGHPAVLSAAQAAAIAAHLDSALRSAEEPVQQPRRRTQPQTAVRPTPIPQATDVSVSRWRKYGHDRLYVDRAGVSLGHADLKTGTLTVDDPNDRPAVERAVARWRGQAGSGAG